jgi:hypothetical protein
MLALFVTVLTHPGLQSFFALDPPAIPVLLAAVGIAALADSLLEAGWRLIAAATARWFRRGDAAGLPPGELLHDPQGGVGKVHGKGEAKASTAPRRSGGS